MSTILGLNISTRTAARKFPLPEKRVTIQPDRSSRLVALTEPTGLAVEGYRLLRRRLCTLYPQGGVVLNYEPESWRWEDAHLGKSRVGSCRSESSGLSCRSGFQSAWGLANFGL